MLYVVAFPQFEPATARRIDAFRAQHEPARARLVAPHLTLMFGVRTTSAQFICALCDQVAQDVPAFDIAFTQSEIVHDPVEGAYKCVLVAGSGYERATALHHRMYAGPHRAELDPRIPYRAHMTVATNDMRDKLAEIDAADLGALPIRSTVDAMHVVRLSEGTLETLCSVPLSERTTPDVPGAATGLTPSP